MLRSLFLSTLIILLSTPLHARAPNGFKEATFQGRSPAYDKGVVIFSLLPGDCSPKKYGDGRGESDCANGGIRSRINAKKHARLGQTLQYSLDIWIDPSFEFNGGKGTKRSALIILEWQRINAIKSHLYELHLDSRRGAMFEDKTCFSNKDFGKWVSFKMLVKWSAKDDGVLKVYCGDRLVYQLVGQNAIPPGCGTTVKRQCELKYQKVDGEIQWQVGPKLGGYGTVYKQYGFSSPFRPFSQNGLKMKVKNLYFGRIK
ncbi:hypothetical protein C1J05_11130 [Sulfitobacter sp. JL08]|uniref:hypothetical protein n=1 Tax=Sulfitobacter sp. JL08 TaxID=2070369 RepID=UPI000E0ABA0E|nr:hypothetical protein [Sulfitobacter sp. JL08]AXI54969.1 hypothetical protein C1J05_11130 [Sulfitobacter sp. JL08]